jgi:hypothetical protein
MSSVDAQAFLDFREGFLGIQEIIGKETWDEIVQGVLDLKDAFASIGDMSAEESVASIKKSLSGIWEPLWGMLKPEIDKLLGKIRDAIVGFWNDKVKPAIGDFINNVAFPGLVTFITETIPDLVSSLAENAPKIANWVGTVMANAFGDLRDRAAELTGENSVLTALLGVLEDLGKYIGIKFGDIAPEPGSFDSFMEMAGDTRIERNPFERSGLAGSIRDLGAAAGESLDNLKTFVGDAIQPLVDSMKDSAFLSAFDAFVDNIESLVNLAFAPITTFFTAVKEIVDVFAKQEGEKKFGWRLLEFLLDLSSFGYDLMAFPFELMKSFLEFGFDLIEWAVTLGETPQPDANKLIQPIENIFASVAKLVTPNTGGPMQQITEWLDDLNDVEEEVLNTGNGENAAPMFEDTIDQSIEALEDMSDRIIGHSIIPDMVKDIKNYLARESPTLFEDLDTAIDDFIAALDDVDLYKKGIDMLQGLFDGMKDKFDTIIWWWKNIALPKIERIMDTLYGIESPSKLFKEKGLMIGEGFFEGIKESFGKIPDFFAPNMNNMSGLAGFAPQQQTRQEYNYQTIADNRNITINSQMSNGYLTLDYSFVKGITS